MGIFFAPYINDCPAPVEINGHRLLILTPERDNIREALPSLGGDEIREIFLGADETKVLADLALSVNAGVVLTPPGMTISTMIKNLENELPWVH